MPTDRQLKSLNFEQARQDLREGLETSREIVRQSRVLIELSESDPPPLGDIEDQQIAS